jgi:hypothetical protein
MYKNYHTRLIKEQGHFSEEKLYDYTFYYVLMRRPYVWGSPVANLKSDPDYSIFITNLHYPILHTPYDVFAEPEGTHVPG